MSLNNRDQEKLQDALQSLVDEGWDMGLGYAKVKDSNSDVVNAYWLDAERHERTIVEQAFDYVVALFAKQAVVQKERES